MKKQQLIFISVLVTLFLVTSPGFSGSEGDLVENIGNGSINWTTGVIQAVGIGAPPEKDYGKPQARPLALRAAKLDALRNILEVVNGVVHAKIQIAIQERKRDAEVVDVSRLGNQLRVARYAGDPEGVR